MLIVRYGVERILPRGTWLINKLVQFAPTRATQQKADPNTDDEEQLADGFDDLQVFRVDERGLEVVADGNDGPHQVQGEPEDAADDEGNSGCLSRLATGYREAIVQAHLRGKSVEARFCDHEEGPSKDLERYQPVYNRLYAADFDVGHYHVVGTGVSFGHLKHLERNIQAPSGNRQHRDNAENDPVNGGNHGIWLSRIGKAIQEAVN